MSFCCEICWEEFLSAFKEVAVNFWNYVVENWPDEDPNSQEFWRKFLDGNCKIQNHQVFYNYLLTACTEVKEHKGCVLQVLSSMNSVSEEIGLREPHIKFILSDLELVHAAQQKLGFLTHQRNDVGLASNPGLETISVDVYRYIISHTGKFFAKNIVRQGNLDVVNYLISSGEIDSLNKPVDQVADACKWSENGAACAKAFCDAGLFDGNQLADAINKGMRYVKPNDMQLL